jgi:hypothetical protein
MELNPGEGQNRESKAAHPEVAKDAVRAQLGKARSTDQSTELRLEDLETNRASQPVSPRRDARLYKMSNMLMQHSA